MFYDEHDEQLYQGYFLKYGEYQRLKDNIDKEIKYLNKEYNNINNGFRNTINQYFKDGFNIDEYNYFLALWYTRRNSNIPKWHVHDKIFGGD